MILGSRTGRWAALALSAALFMLAAPAAHAQLVNPFGREATAITPADLEEITAAFDVVLNKYEAGANATWASRETDRSGIVVLTETYERRGLKCATVYHLFTSGRNQTPFSAPLCQVESGDWKFAF